MYEMSARVSAAARLRVQLPQGQRLARLEDTSAPLLGRVAALAGSELGSRGAFSRGLVAALRRDLDQRAAANLHAGRRPCCRAEARLLSTLRLYAQGHLRSGERTGDSAKKVRLSSDGDLYLRGVAALGLIPCRVLQATAGPCAGGSLVR